MVAELVVVARHQTAEVWRLQRRAVERANETDPELLAELFTRIDKDGSGSLEREEIALMSLELGKPLSEPELDEAMAEMDADGSGEVDFDEFERWFERMKASGNMPSWGAGLARLQAR